MFSFYRKRVEKENDKLQNESISILIPAYKSYDFIEQCLDSVSNQDYEGGYEIIVGIDGCKRTLDKINEIKHKYKNFFCYYSDKNIGTYVMLNSLILKSNYDIITIFGSDDIMNNDYLSYNKSLLKFNNYVVSKCVNFKGRTETCIENKSFSIFLYKYHFLKLNGYDEYRFSCDDEFIKRLKNVGLSTINSDKITYKKRLHSNNISNNDTYGINSYYNKEINTIFLNRNNDILDEIKTSELIPLKENKNINKIAICIPIYKRYTITDYVLSYYKKIKDDLKDEIDIILISAGSEGEISEFISRKNEFIYLECNNETLSLKQNIMYKEAMKYEPNACIKIDSDSIISIEFFKYYDSLINNGYDYGGIKDIYFIVKNYALYWGGYTDNREGDPVGTGLFMSKNLLEKLDWKPFGDIKINKHLDSFLNKRIIDLNLDIKKDICKCDSVGGICLDLKSDIFISDIKNFEFNDILSLDKININFSNVFDKLIEIDKRKIKFNNKIKLDLKINKYFNKNLIKFKYNDRLTIIIPVYKNSLILERCLNSILNSTYDNFNLLVINDSPMDKNIDYVLNDYNESFYNRFQNSELKYITNDNNLGFIKTVNKGLNSVYGDIIILNSDTMVNHDWIERMLSYKKIHKVGSITPLSNSASICSFPMVDKDNTEHYRNLSSKSIDMVFRRIPNEFSNESPTGVGFCMFMSRECIDKIGIFDDINFIIGYGEENDWCYRAMNEGYCNLLVPNIYVSHDHGVSFSDSSELKKIREHNKSSLISKHPSFYSDISKSKYRDNFKYIFPILKFSLDYEYFRIKKNPVKIILGDIDIDYNSYYSEVKIELKNQKIFLSFNDFKLEEELIIKNDYNNLKLIINILNSSLIEIHEDFDKKILEYLYTFCDKKIVKIIKKNNKKKNKIVFELPHYKMSSGGIVETIKFNDKFPEDYEVSYRFQKKSDEIPTNISDYTYGLPDDTFPECDVCITYSDNPYLDDLIKIGKCKKILLHTLSYGMAIERERKNVLNKDVFVICSTKKIENGIILDGGKVNRVGFALDMDNMYVDNNIKRNRYLSILYHPSELKRYKLAVEVSNKLYKDGKIDGVITFGGDIDYDKSIKPISLVKHFKNANRDEIRYVFNSCMCFLMPSITEGLNLTPIESVLCGCIPILCDGAIGELFFDKENCFICEKDNVDEMYNLVNFSVENHNIYNISFQKKMRSVITPYTWDSVIKNIINLI